MRNWFPVLALLILQSSVQVNMVFAQVQSVPFTEKSQVEVQWKPEPDAMGYQIEIKTLKGHKIRKANAQKAIYVFKAQPGRYQLRAQAQTEFGTLGPWSEWINVNIPPRKVKFDLQQNFTATARSETLSGEVKVHWQGAQAAQYYRVIFKNEKGEFVKSVKAEQSFVQTELPPGRYTVGVISVLEDGLESTPAQLQGNFIVESAKLPMPDVKPLKNSQGQIEALEFESRAGVSYMLSLERNYYLSSNWLEIETKALTSQIGVSKWIPPVDLPPAQYRVSLWLDSKGWQRSEKSTWEFVIKPKELDLN